MGQFGTYYKGEKRKKKKSVLEKKARVLTSKKTFVVPKVQIIKKGKDN